MSKITNTAKLDPMVHLLDAMARGPSQSIEYSEARGAQEMAAQASQLPTDGLGHPAFTQMGIVLGDLVEGDDMFRRVTLPSGWKIQRTDHNMWTHLVDDKERKRAEIFYKAAFYDRRAFIRPSRRFSIESDYESIESRRRRVLVKDGAMVLKDWPWRDTYEAAQPDNDAAAAWLSERFPNWEDPSAHWDE